MVDAAHPDASALPVDASEVAGRLRFSVARLARILRQQDRSGLAPTLGAVLATVAREGPLTLGELAAQEQLTPPSITKVVERLEGLGLVDRSRDPLDRRVCRVQVSPSGQRQLDDNASRRTAWLATRLERLAPEQLAGLAAAADVLEELTRWTPPDVAP